MSDFSPIKRGFDEMKTAGGSGNWFKLGAGESADVVVLSASEDVLSVEQCAIWLDGGNSPVWVYTGVEDPSVELGIDRGFRAYIGIQQDGEAKIWSLSRTVVTQLKDISEAGGLDPGAIIRIKRTGTGLKTRYSVIPRGKSKDISGVEHPDILAALGPLTSEAVWEMLCEKLGMGRDDVIARYGKRPTKAKGTVLAEDEDDDVEEVDIDELEI